MFGNILQFVQQTSIRQIFDLPLVKNRFVKPNAPVVPTPAMPAIPVEGILPRVLVMSSAIHYSETAAMCDPDATPRTLDVFGHPKGYHHGIRVDSNIPDSAPTGFDQDVVVGVHQEVVHNINAPWDPMEHILSECIHGFIPGTVQHDSIRRDNVMEELKLPTADVAKGVYYAFMKGDLWDTQWMTSVPGFTKDFRDILNYPYIAHNTSHIHAICKGFTSWLRFAACKEIEPQHMKTWKFGGLGCTISPNGWVDWNDIISALRMKPGMALCSEGEILSMLWNDSWSPHAINKGHAKSRFQLLVIVQGTPHGSKCFPTVPHVNVLPSSIIPQFKLSREFVAKNAVKGGSYARQGSLQASFGEAQKSSNWEPIDGARIVGLEGLLQFGSIGKIAAIRIDHGEAPIVGVDPQHYKISIPLNAYDVGIGSGAAGMFHVTKLANLRLILSSGAIEPMDRIGSMWSLFAAWDLFRKIAQQKVQHKEDEGPMMQIACDPKEIIDEHTEDGERPVTANTGVMICPANVCVPESLKAIDILSRDQSHAAVLWHHIMRPRKCIGVAPRHLIDWQHASPEMQLISSALQTALGYDPRKREMMTHDDFVCPNPDCGGYITPGFLVCICCGSFLVFLGWDKTQLRAVGYNPLLTTQSKELAQFFEQRVADESVGGVSIALTSDNTVPGDVTPIGEVAASAAGDAPDVEMRDSVRGGMLGDVPLDEGMLTAMRSVDVAQSLMVSIQTGTDYVSRQEGLRRILIEAIKEELPWQVVWITGRFFNPRAARAGGHTAWCRTKNIYKTMTPVPRTFVSWDRCFDDLDDPCFNFQDVHKRLLRWIRNLAMQLVPVGDQFTAPIPGNDVELGPGNDRPGIAKLCDDYSTFTNINFRENWQDTEKVVPLHERTPATSLREVNAAELGSHLWGLRLGSKRGHQGIIDKISQHRHDLFTDEEKKYIEEYQYIISVYGKFTTKDMIAKKQAIRRVKQKVQHDEPEQYDQIWRSGEAGREKAKYERAGRDWASSSQSWNTPQSAQQTGSATDQGRSDRNTVRGGSNWSSGSGGWTSAWVAGTTWASSTWRGSAAQYPPEGTRAYNPTSFPREGLTRALTPRPANGPFWGDNNMRIEITVHSFGVPKVQITTFDLIVIAGVLAFLLWACYVCCFRKMRKAERFRYIRIKAGQAFVDAERNMMGVYIPRSRGPAPMAHMNPNCSNMANPCFTVMPLNAGRVMRYCSKCAGSMDAMVRSGCEASEYFHAPGEVDWVRYAKRFHSSFGFFLRWKCLRRIYGIPERSERPTFLPKASDEKAPSAPF